MWTPDVSIGASCHNGGKLQMRRQCHEHLFLWTQQPMPFTAGVTQARLADRRSGIGHAKQGGQLGKSRRKKDETTLAAGYASIGGFNLRQLIRHLLGKDVKAMA